MLEVGPDTVLVLAGGTGRQAPGAVVEAALDWIDDPVGLLDERPVGVADLWRTVMATVLGEGCDSVVLVHPADWPRSRVDRVVAAANTVADQVVPVSRTEWTGAGTLEIVDDDPPATPRSLPTGRLVAAGAAAIVVLVALLVTTAMAAGPPARTLVEGRIEVRVPPGWAVVRVTSGPGSRRVQVSPPADPGIALHITQSYAPETTPAKAAEVLGRAIADQPAGVFVDFRASADVAGRQAVTYREVRPGRIIGWSVVLAGSTRISIGCQSPPGREQAVRAACDEAVGSAREGGTDSPR